MAVVRHLRRAWVVLGLFSLAATAWHAPESNLVEKKFPFPSPVQWKRGNVEISLIALAWGPANSPEMISRGSKELPNEKPEFFSDRSFVLAMGFRATAPGSIQTKMYTGGGLVRVKIAEGDLDVPLILTPSGFVPFRGSPGIFDIYFDQTNTTEYWDFFLVQPNEKEFLFQAPVVSSFPGPASKPELSFRVILKDNDLVIVNASPATQTQCPDFTKNFTGTVGQTTKVNLQLTRRGAVLSGTHQYVEVGKTLWLKGRIDFFGNFALEEEYPEGQVTGTFKGKLSDACRTMTGYFSKPDGSRLQPFDFREVQATDSGKTR